MNEQRINTREELRDKLQFIFRNFNIEKRCPEHGHRMVCTDINMTVGVAELVWVCPSCKDVEREEVKYLG